MKNFSDWLSESKVEDSLLHAKEIFHDSDMKELFNDVEEGKYPSIQVIKTPGATSYIGVALNDGFPLTEVFHTSSPIEALLAIIILDNRTTNPEVIKGELTREELLLQYVVFAGDRKPTSEEMAKRFNITYQDPDDNSVSFYTSTPIRKTY